jgi:hypothetical protein
MTALPASIPHFAFRVPHFGRCPLDSRAASMPLSRMRRLFVLAFALGALLPCARAAKLEDSREYQAARDATDRETVTLVLELTHEGHAEQWLLTLGSSARPLRSGEKSAAGLIAKFQTTLHSSTGHEHRFPDEPFAMDLRLVGPFGAEGTAKPSTVVERAVGNRVYFEPGLFPTAEVYSRLLQSGQPLPKLALLFRADYSPERIAADQAAATAAGMTLDDEREIARAAFALNQFGYLAGKLDVFRELLDAVIELPTLFNGLYINLDWAHLQRTTGTAPDGKPEVRFDVPLMLQTKSRLSGTIAFVRPVDGLRYCAGIIEARLDRSEKSPGSILRVWRVR